MTKGIIVLGMHRSGTSLVAEMIHRWGAYHGSVKKLTPSNWWNPQGHWEYRPLVEFNRNLLKVLGGSWCLPPPEKQDSVLVGLASEATHREVANDLIRTMQSSGQPWFWKDPRLCLLLPFWREIWGDVLYIVCVRDPMEIALSLRERNGIPLSAGFLLWQRYMSGIINGVGTSESKIVVSYGNVLSNTASECARLSKFLDHGCRLEVTHESGRPESMRTAVNSELSRASRYRTHRDDGVLTEVQQELFQWLMRESIAQTTTTWLDSARFQLSPDWRERIADHGSMFKGSLD